MDTRKIQTVGGGTYTVSLPKEWAQSQNLTTGDTVHVDTYIDGILAVQAQDCGGGGSDEMTVRITNDGPESLERTLRAAYAVGAKEIVLEADEAFSTEQQRIVEQVARTLIGVSLAEKSETRMRFQTLLDTDEVSVRQTVRQLRFVALSMHRDATGALTGDAKASDLTERDDQADRLFALIDRALSRGLTRLDEVDSLGVTRPELFELWATTQELERVADHAVGIASAASRLDKPVEENVLEATEEVATDARAIVEEAVDLVVGDASADSVRPVFDSRDQLRTDIDTVSRRLIDSSPNKSQLNLILERVRRTAEHGGNIAEFGLRKALRQGELTETAAPESSNGDDPVG